MGTGRKKKKEQGEGRDVDLMGGRIKGERRGEEGKEKRGVREERRKKTVDNKIQVRPGVLCALDSHPHLPLVYSRGEEVKGGREGRREGRTSRCD